MATQPLLDLSTIITRPSISIDGKAFEMLSPEELSVVDTHRFALWGQQLQQMSGDETRSDALEALVDELSEKILVGVPGAVLAKLTGTQRFAVVEVFTMLLLARKAELVGAAGTILSGLKVQPKADPKARPKTGAGSSRGSSGSTAGNRAGGSSKRR